MAVTTESTTLHRTAEERHDDVVKAPDRSGDLPAMTRLLGDVERIDPDASELDDLTPRPAASTAEASDIHVLEDTPLGPDVCAIAGHDGVGGDRR
jgi:hypothetical protein